MKSDCKTQVMLLEHRPGGKGEWVHSGSSHTFNFRCSSLVYDACVFPSALKHRKKADCIRCLHSNTRCTAQEVDFAAMLRGGSTLATAEQRLFPRPTRERGAVTCGGARISDGCGGLSARPYITSKALGGEAESPDQVPRLMYVD